MKTKKAPETRRQGDVILIRTSARKVGAEVPRDGLDRAVLAAGELTGHHHAIAAKAATLHELGDDAKAEQVGERILKTLAPADLTHEEHAAIRLPKGTYVVRVAREYDALGSRRVED